MKKLFSTTAVALLLAAPAFASALIGNDSHDTNYSQGQSATGVGIGKGGNASSHATSGSYSGASAGAVNTTKQLNSQQLNSLNSAKQGQGQGQSADNNGNQYTSDDDNKTEVYAISYTDAAPNTVAASIGDGVVVTTWGVKVLGPVFGMTDQHVHYLPAAVESAADLGFKATTNDGTQAGEQKQFTYIAAICAHDEALAEQLNFGCK